jgi:hypothetical protein
LNANPDFGKEASAYRRKRKFPESQQVKDLRLKQKETLKTIKQDRLRANQMSSLVQTLSESQWGSVRSAKVVKSIKMSNYMRPLNKSGSRETATITDKISKPIVVKLSP